jgi:transcriptional regulator with XRE-family HTH domain
VAVCAAVDGGLANYAKGPMLKSELPGARQILQLLQWLDPRQDIKLSLRNTFEDEFGKSRYNLFFRAKLTPRSKEWQFFQKHFGFSDGQIEQFHKLPSGRDEKLNLPCAEYILKHPEHYDTFGKWLKAMRETLMMSLDDVGKCLGVSRQMIDKIELKYAEDPFIKGKGKVPIPEQYLNADPYGIFPKDEHGNVTQEFRERFLALSKPNVMKKQYDEAQNWITREQLFKAVGLEWDRKLHDAIFQHYVSDTEGLASGTSGLVVGKTYAMPVRRNKEGELRYHKSGIEMLKADPEIGEHIARQHNESRAR